MRLNASAARWLSPASAPTLKLQKSGLIRYAQGKLVVLDRPGIEKRACECYAVVKKEYDRLLPEELAV